MAFCIWKQGLAFVMALGPSLGAFASDISNLSHLSFAMGQTDPEQDCRNRLAWLFFNAPQLVYQGQAANAKAATYVIPEDSVLALGLTPQAAEPPHVSTLYRPLPSKIVAADPLPPSACREEAGQLIREAVREVSRKWSAARGNYNEYEYWVSIQSLRQIGIPPRPGHIVISEDRRKKATEQGDSLTADLYRRQQDIYRELRAPQPALAGPLGPN